MRKYILTYLMLTMVVVSAIMAPTYLNLFEEICEKTKIVDIEKDKDDVIKELEIKFFYSNQEIFICNNILLQIKLPYIAKVYHSVYKNCELPPPEPIV